MIRKFLELTLPMKLLWSSVAVMIVGPGINALVSEFAAYAYALDIGIRPPLEGIPYLTATVTVVSIVLPLVATGLFLILRGWFGAMATGVSIPLKDLSGMSERLQRYLPPRSNDSGLSFAVEIWMSILISSVYMGVVYFIHFASFVWLYDESDNFNQIAIRTFVLFVILHLSLYWRTLAWWLSFVAIVLFYLSTFGLMFSTASYADFLRMVGYGGGAKVLVEHETANGDSREEDYYLLLRTSEALIALKQDKVTVIEIPIESVSSIQYALGSQSTDYVDVAKLELKSKEDGDDDVPAAPVSRAVESGV